MTISIYLFVEKNEQWSTKIDKHVLSSLWKMCLNLLENTKAFTDGSKNHETSRAWWHTRWIHTTALGLYALESSPTHRVKPCLKKIPGRGEKKPSIHPRLSRGSLTLTNKKGREAEGPRTQEQDTEEQTANHTAPTASAQSWEASPPTAPPSCRLWAAPELQSSRAALETLHLRHVTTRTGTKLLLQ